MSADQQPAIRLFAGGQEIPLRVFDFPGGEVQVRLPDEVPGEWPLIIDARLHSARAIMALLVLTDAIRRRWPGAPIGLRCPYLPYARQDRVVYPGEALSAAVMCQLINGQNYAWVEVWDAHSEVTLALLDRVRHRTADGFVAPHVRPGEVVVAPDHGALRRASLVARAAGVPVIAAEKTRSPDTGEIGGVTVPPSAAALVTGGVLVVDDICDGGRTFVALAQALRPLTTGPLRLYVTHGIFSAGFDGLRAHYDEILTANPFPTTLPTFVRVIAT